VNKKWYFCVSPTYWRGKRTQKEKDDSFKKSLMDDEKDSLLTNGDSRDYERVAD
jgi:hypothetical protein